MKIAMILGVGKSNFPDQAENQFMVKYLIENWSRKLQPEEIEKAFNLFIQGKLEIDEVKASLSPTYFEKVLQSYMTYKHKLIVPTSSPAIPQTCELTEQEKAQIIWDGILEAFERFKSTGEKVEFGGIKYDFLKERGMIHFTKERRNKMMELAKNRVKMEFEVEITTARTINDMRKLQEQINNNGKDYQARCVEEAKTIAINTLFAEMVESGTEINDLIPA